MKVNLFMGLQWLLSSPDVILSSLPRLELTDPGWEDVREAGCEADGNNGIGALLDVEDSAVSRSVEEARSLSLAHAVAVEKEGTFLASRVSIRWSKEGELIKHPRFNLCVFILFLVRFGC